MLPTHKTMKATELAAIAERKEETTRGAAVDDSPTPRFEPDVTWESGCLRMDKDFVRYLGKLVVSGAVLAFSFVQLTRQGVDVAYYSSTVSLILGTFLGSASTPAAKRRSD